MPFQTSWVIQLYLILIAAQCSNPKHPRWGYCHTVLRDIMQLLRRRQGSLDDLVRFFGRTFPCSALMQLQNPLAMLRPGDVHMRLSASYVWRLLCALRVPVRFSLDSKPCQNLMQFCFFTGTFCEEHGTGQFQMTLPPHLQQRWPELTHPQEAGVPEGTYEVEEPFCVISRVQKLIRYLLAIVSHVVPNVSLQQVIMQAPDWTPDYKRSLVQIIQTGLQAVLEQCVFTVTRGASYTICNVGMGIIRIPLLMGYIEARMQDVQTAVTQQPGNSMLSAIRMMCVPTHLLYELKFNPGFMRLFLKMCRGVPSIERLVTGVSGRTERLLHVLIQWTLQVYPNSRGNAANGTDETSKVSSDAPLSQGPPPGICTSLCELAYNRFHRSFRVQEDDESKHEDASASTPDQKEWSKVMDRAWGQLLRFRLDVNVDLEQSSCQCMHMRLPMLVFACNGRRYCLVLTGVLSHDRVRDLMSALALQDVTETEDAEMIPADILNIIRGQLGDYASALP